VDDILLTNVLLDHTGEVRVHALASLMRRVLTVVGASHLTVTGRSLSVMGAPHMARGLVNPVPFEFTSGGSRHHIQQDMVENDGEQFRIQVFLDGQCEEVARD